MNKIPDVNTKPKVSLGLVVSTLTIATLIAAIFLGGIYFFGILDDRYINNTTDKDDISYLVETLKDSFQEHILTESQKNEILQLIQKEAPTYPAQSHMLPIGTVVAFAGTVPPEKWLICDGKTIPEEYSELREMLGAADTPDLQGRFIRGAGVYTYEGIEKGARLNTNGPDLLKKHHHVVNYTTGSHGGGDPSLPLYQGVNKTLDVFQTTDRSYNTTEVGQEENMVRHYNLMYIIRAQ